ncbi:MAG: diguanylate cyclase [Candidatus Obscuribacterales bacterium]|nr:diguanylate cyclase [Candidatus Obscuribacterales bacterium]
MFQRFHGQAKAQEGQVRSLQSENLQLDRVLREKDREIDQLKNQLANAEARLEELMGKDNLTSLPNRHIFKEHLTHSLKRAVRLGYSLSLLLIDIDHLREVNSRAGYEKGDEVLIEVAKTLQNSVREIDMPARWGGEELVAVLHETDVEAAVSVAERIRRKINMLDIKDPVSGKAITITATLAVASYPRHSNQPQELLEVAYDALVSAKNKGGNIVVVADSNI